MTGLFKNPHDALTFAYNYQSQQYALSPMSKLALKGAGTGKGLVSTDGAGQAGMILAEVARMSSLHRACIVARYANKHIKCHCCGSDALSADYRDAVGNLRELCSNQVIGMSLRAMRETIIQAFYERRVSIPRKAEELRIARSTANDQKQLIWAWLKKIDADALADIANRLEKLISADMVAA
jgi:hypothetical protein